MYKYAGDYRADHKIRFMGTYFNSIILLIRVICDRFMVYGWETSFIQGRKLVCLLKCLYVKQKFVGTFGNQYYKNISIK